MKNKSGMGCFVFVGVVAALLFLISRPGVIRFLNSTPADLGWVTPKKSYEDLEEENAAMLEALSELSSRLDELYWDASDIADNMVPAWSYLTEHDPDSDITMESAGNDLEDASCDMDSLMQEILKLESIARTRASSYS